MFETTGELNENTLKELGKHLSAPIQRFYRIFFICVFSCAAVWMVVVQKGVFAGIFAVGALFMCAEHYAINKRYIKIIADRLREMNDTATATYTTSFGDDGVHSINHVSGGHAILQYQSLCRIAETEHFYALFTKAAQFVTVFKSGLNDGQRQELISYLKTKPTKIKWNT